MAEYFVVRQPSADELQRTFGGLSFAEFRELSDQQVDELRAGLVAEGAGRLSLEGVLLEGLKATHEDEDFSLVLKTVRFNQFRHWRKWGVPDRDVSTSDIMEMVEHSVKTRLAEDPTYGKLSFGQFDALPDSTKGSIRKLYEYFESMRDPYEYMTLGDDGFISDGLELTSKNIQELEQQGVLEWAEGADLYNPSNEYWLARPYYDHLLVRMFAPAHAVTTE